ncbi:EAL domain-containing protein [Rheinheimera pleomorphica]|uniref:EAL domain-containing protein n=1 Tax=Rheinheimera pleomorphica TaxID=2703963 RepID=UPI00141FECE8|nr:EAL domain-containing protein [Rheinheimera pleomorphica]
MNFLPQLLRYAALILLLSAVSVPATTLLRPLTPDHGLSQGSINDLLLDQDGFLWLATAGGLNRYDSNQVVQLSSADYGLREVAFSKLLQTRDNHIYAATETGELYHYDRESGLMTLLSQLTQQHETLRYANIVGLAELDADTLLLTSSSALFQVSRHSGSSSKLLDLADIGQPDGWLRNLYVYQHYVLLAAFNGVIIYDLNSNSHQYLHHVDPNQSNADQQHVKVLDIQHDKLWIGTVEGLYSVSVQQLLDFLQQQTPYQVNTEIPGFNIWQLLWQNNEALIPTELGLYRFTPATGDTTALLAFSDAGLGLADNSMLDIVADKDGGYWLASRDDGAYYWHPRSRAFSQLGYSSTASNGLSNDKVFSLLQDNGTLWAGTANGLNKIQLSDNTVRSYFVSNDPKAVYHNGTVLQIMPAGNNRYWLHTGTGLKLFDGQTAQLLPPPLQQPEDAKLLNERSGGYYADKHYLYFFRQSKLLRYNTQDGVIEDLTAKFIPAAIDNGAIIFAALQGRHTGLLVGVPDEVWLWQPDTGNRQLLYRHPNYLPQSNRIADTAIVDRFNRLWLGISGIGLLGFDADSLQLQHRFNVADSLQSDAVYSLQQDAYGDIWFSSHKGLARLNTTQLQVELFTRDDGVATHEYNSGAVTRLDDGRLVYGAMRGLTLVQPALLQQAPVTPEVIITGISVLSGDLKPRYSNLNGRHFSLSHQDLGITLQFSAMSFSRNHKMRYRYWLSGAGDIQYPVQSKNEVIFPQLNPGKYQFHVVALSPDSGAESPAATLWLTIQPAPWQSDWAIAAYLLLALFAIYKLYRFRRRQHAEVRLAHQKVQQSEQRLKQALQSVNSGAWEWRASNNQLFAARIHTMLGYREQMNPLTMQQHMTLIHADDKINYASQWQRFLQEPASGFDCTYRMQHQDGHWLWFRDQGKATDVNSDNKVLKVIGTFSNITETRANQEKARLFGEAFQQTRDWVVILDNRQRVLAANQSFAAAFGNMEQYLDKPRTHHLGISLVRRRFYTKLLKAMQSGEHWQGEEQVITPDGRERPTLINISAIGEQQQQTFFVLVFTDITAQKHAEDELRYLANYDALTGLPNRALLMDRIYHGIDQAKRDKRSLALCFIDLDKFKQINDSLGHDIGDLLLKEVARRLTLTLRESDTVARLGGDEFVVLLEGYKAEDNISHVARKMLSVVSEPMSLATHTVGVSPSIGIAVYPDDALNAGELLKHADVAMYHAKEAGRNNFQFFTAEMNEKAHMRLARETRLRKALHNDEFINFYQPIINSQTRQVVGAEVLLRWQSSEGIVSPAEFIPLAEELRLIINMTQALLERALTDLRQWHDDGHLLYLSVNLSTQHLEQPALADYVRELLQKHQLSASYLRFEVTESALMRDHQSAIETMLALSDLGVQLALDDFGTGYSSLKYLKELPIDGIKIDRSFVQDIGIDSSDETIIEAMLSMANSLGMYCVAEGVETEQQLAFFSRRHCYLIQGYLFAKPMPGATMLQFLQQEFQNI